jgi:hypothetical protein
MIEACDRLGQKLDALAGLFREQMPSWQPGGAATARAATAKEAPPTIPACPAEPMVAPSQEQPRAAAATLPPTGVTPDPQSGHAASLAEALSRSSHDWQEQSSQVQQALEGIMAHLEKQAATAPPQVDVAGILTRLKDLEEQQQNMQSQFNNNR